MRRREVLFALATIGCGKPRVFTCTDTQGLTPQDIQARTAMGYVEPSTDPQRSCSSCQQYVPSDGCGTCKLIKGPVHPNGSCKAHTRV